MSHSVFGWSYPPGCSGPPDDDGFYPAWHDDLIQLLEDNDVSQEAIDNVIKLVDDDFFKREAERERKMDEEASIRFAIDEVSAERVRQKELWGNEFDDKNTANDWCAYITNYVASGAYAGRQEKYDPKKFRECLKKAACLCIAAMEAIDRNGDCAPRHYESLPNSGATTKD